MKHAKITAIVMVAVLAVAAFSGCVRRAGDLDNVSPVPDTANNLPDTSPGNDNNPANDTFPGNDTSPGNNTIVPDTSPGNDTIVPDRNDTSPGNNTTVPDRNDTDRLDNSPEDLDQSIASAMSADFSEIGALDGQKDTGFPGGPVDEKNRPSGPLAYQQKYGKYGAHFIVPNSNKIYLTFDEGYEYGYTSKILDILKEKDVKAVFFVTYPYAKTEQALVKRMIEEGHTLGNHSSKHPVYPDLPLAEAAEDLMNLHEYVLANYGYKMWLFRPPEGAFSEQTLALAQSLGYNTMLWSFAYKDYDVDNQPLAIEATGNIIKKAHPGEIALLHAVSRTNSEILGDVIDALRDKGFEFADYFYFQ